MLLNLAFALVLARYTYCVQKMPPKWVLGAGAALSIGLFLAARASTGCGRDPPEGSELSATINQVKSNYGLYREWQAAVKNHKTAVRRLASARALVFQNQAAVYRAMEAERKAFSELQQLEDALHKLPCQGDGNDP